MTVQEVLSLSSSEIAKLNRKELARVTKVLTDAANKRLKRLETAFGDASRAYQRAQESGGRFSTGGKNQGQLQSEFKRARSFLTSKSSTVSGYRKERKSMLDRLNVPESERDEFNDRDFWKQYRRLEKSNKALVNNYGSTETQRLLYRYMDSEDGYVKILERLQGDYEDEYDDDLSEWFDDADEWDGEY